MTDEQRLDKFIAEQMEQLEHMRKYEFLEMLVEHRIAHHACQMFFEGRFQQEDASWHAVQVGIMDAELKLNGVVAFR